MPPMTPRRTVLATLALSAVLLLPTGCSKSGEGASASAPQPATVIEPPAVPPPEAAPPPPTEEAANWSPEALDELTAPIALYPDPILAQVLSAATDSQEVMDAGNWLIDNAALKDKALSTAASAAGFTPSVQALVHFPTVMDMMCREIDWTRQLGDAFGADQAAVLASVQRLRRQAQTAGNLASSPQITVQQTVQQEKEVIVIQPADPKVVYVPQYEPAQVYAPAPAPAAPASTSGNSGISTSQAVMGGLLAFGAGVLVANMFDDDDDHHHDDYWYGHGYPNWGYGGVYYGPRPYYPHNTFIYAPRYPNYRPQHYYRPPASYPYHYRGEVSRQARGSAPATPAYFNRFEQNRNRMEGYTPRPPVTGQRGKPIAAYRGDSAASRPAVARPGTAPSARPAAASAAGRPAVATSGRVPAARGATVDRASQLPATAAATQRRPSSREAKPDIRPDRGYPLASGDRSDNSLRQSRGGAAIAGAGARDGARERAASERGRASMKSAPRPSAQRPSTQRDAPGSRQPSQSRATPAPRGQNRHQ